MSAKTHDAPGTLAEARRLLGRFRAVTLVTIGPDGIPRGRPMAVQQPIEKPGCDLWFVTSEETPKVDEVRGDDHVCVCAHDERTGCWVSLSCRARVSRDRHEIERLYDPSWEVWFPDGLDDPTLALLELDVVHASFFEPPNRLAQVATTVRALVRRRPAQELLPPVRHVGAPPSRRARR